ncbi:polyisoprenoid-binding protein [Polaribacter reichenbachii]|uniref:Polyisoprenoid-binding protein n=1 Tax=Polaribacter reichenbachii TaxID=996801 RepID=A0A1B8U7F5_9FLAO|nr:YceI family protein [Polaribacter reichenbachii]APZ46411.1 polyisoprenoid-binding protein [Polaribacter reichenbachii]AUC20276.1 polyisoprenoid-binding protein [Polaribacter reichenbachii]OBY67826.1 polyisoprenoid-binding protein [Polaribacter reichenbachii]
MKKIVLSLVVVASVLTACKSEKKEKVATEEAKEVVVNVSELNNVDTEASVLTWKGTKPGGAHDGTVALKSGGLLLEDGALKGGEFVVDLTTITNSDMKGSGGAAKLEGHLKNADFFDVEVYSTSTFVITNVEPKEGKLHVTGNLQIKDVTKSITIPATVTTEGGVTTFKSETFNVNRADFNVKYGSKSFFDNLKDKFIDDMMELSFEVKTKA